MSGPKRNPDKLNTIGVVVVGICGAVMVYVTIVALQAFYVNDTSELQTMMDYGGQDKLAKSHRADELRNISEPASNPPAPGMSPTFRIKIEDAMRLVAEDVKKDPAHLVPLLPKAEKATIEPVFGRPKQAPPPAAPPAEAGSAAPAAGSGLPLAPAEGAGSPAPKAGDQPKAQEPAKAGDQAKAQPKAEPAKAGDQPKAQPKPAAPKADAQPKAGSAAPKNP